MKTSLLDSIGPVSVVVLVIIILLEPYMRDKGPFKEEFGFMPPLMGQITEEQKEVVVDKLVNYGKTLNRLQEERVSLVAAIENSSPSRAWEHTGNPATLYVRALRDLDREIAEVIEQQASATKLAEIFYPQVEQEVIGVAAR